MRNKIPERKLRRIYQPIGMIIVGWGAIDTSLTAAALLAIKITKKRYYKSHLPINAGNRLNILIDHFKKALELSHMKSEALKICATVQEIQSLREMLVHGYPCGYDAQKDIYYFNRLDRIKSPAPAEKTHRTRFMAIPFDALRQRTLTTALTVGMFGNLVVQLTALNQGHDSAHGEIGH
jgi:hypothetical protein